MTPSSSPDVHRVGQGPPLVLVHGLGASRDCWRLVLPLLATEREVVTFDLPGFGQTPPADAPATVQGFADVVEVLLRREGLLDADLVGSSMGGEVVLELARRGHGGHVVALAPSGYWRGLELAWFRLVAWTAAVLVSVLGPAVPLLIGVRWVRSALLRPLSPRPAQLPDIVVDGSRLFGTTPAFGPALRALTRRRPAVSLPPGSRSVTLGWGRNDGLCLPAQAERAVLALPGARLHWFESSGHLPPWDEPEATAAMLLGATRSVCAEVPLDRG